MIYIGNHLSTSKGFLAMGKAESKLGGNTFAFFTRNPRGGAAKEIEKEDTDALIRYMKENGFGPLVAHAPYTMNVCAQKEDVRRFSKEMLQDDLKRMEFLPGNFYNFHPGSHVGAGSEEGIRLIIEALNEALIPEQSTIVLLETMAGKGSEVGCTFEEIQAILNGVSLKEKMGVCFDTCHVYDAGYDIVNDLDGVLKHFDEVIGIEKLRAVHLNDSMNPFSSHKDRHQKIGEGSLGWDAIERIIKHPLLQNKPFILETPNEDEGYAKEIKMIKNTLHFNATM